MPTQRRIVSALATVTAITATAVAWWVLARRNADVHLGVDSESQTDVPQRLDVDIAVAQADTTDKT